MYCSAPWTTVQIKNDGQFSYCCMSRDPMDDNLNGPNLVKGREKIIAGEILPVCQTKCFDIEHLYSSQRLHLNRRWPIKNTIAPEANADHIEYIDLRMGNICNYMCLMCGDRDSHLWGKANKKENPYVSWSTDPIKYKQIIDFVASCKNLKCISLAGGEPFYNKKQLFDLIDGLDRNIELKFITNMSFCDDEIINKLNEFKKGRMHCSIDGVGKWIELQRFRSDWNNVETNLVKFAKELHPGWQLVLVPTFTVLNTLGLPEFVDWYYNKLQPLNREIIFAYTICTMPERMTLYNIPLKERQAIIENIKLKEYNFSDNFKNLFNAIVQDKTPNHSTIIDLKEYIDYLKRVLNIDIYDRLPILKEIVVDATY